MIIHPISRRRTTVRHGEGLRDAWAIGETEAGTVYVDLDGLGFVDRGSPLAPEFVGLGLLVEPGLIPPLPGDDDDLGWEALARVVREAAAGVQQSLFGEQG